MSTPAGPVVDLKAVSETCSVLRQLAASDRALSPGRGHVSATLAALVDATAQHHEQLPAEVTRRVLDVMQAVDAATGRRR